MKTCSLALLLVLLGCDARTSHHGSKYGYDEHWSMNVIGATMIPSSEIRKVEVYSDVSKRGYRKPLKILSSSMPLLWMTEDPKKIDQFLVELRSKQARPRSREAPVHGQDLTLHLVLWGADGKIAYGRCLWHSDSTVPYGFTIAYGSEGSYRYTETLLPWLTRRELGPSIRPAPGVPPDSSRKNKKADKNGASLRSERDQLIVIG